MVHNVITRRQFTFSTVAGSGTLDVPLVRALDVADAKAIDLVVRVHAVSITASSGATIGIHACAISLTSEEPDVDFTNTSDLGLITLTDTTVAPILALDSLTGPWGHMIRIFVRGTQPASPAAALTATLSIDLVVRDN